MKTYTLTAEIHDDGADGDLENALSANVIAYLLRQRMPRELVRGLRIEGVTLEAAVKTGPATDCHSIRVLDDEDLERRRDEARNDRDLARSYQQRQDIFSKLRDDRSERPMPEGVIDPPDERTA